MGKSNQHTWYLNACERARKLARQRNDTVYVYIDGDEPGGYGYATLFDCGTWYAGQEPVAVAYPDGELER